MSFRTNLRIEIDESNNKRVFVGDTEVTGVISVDLGLIDTNNIPEAMIKTFTPEVVYVEKKKVEDCSLCRYFGKKYNSHVDAHFPVCMANRDKELPSIISGFLNTRAILVEPTKEKPDWCPAENNKAWEHKYEFK